jgi:hypothetical protein
MPKVEATPKAFDEPKTVYFEESTKEKVRRTSKSPRNEKGDLNFAKLKPLDSIHSQMQSEASNCQNSSSQHYFDNSPVK